MSSGEENDEIDEVGKDSEISDPALQHEIVDAQNTLGVGNCTIISAEPAAIRLKIFRPYFGDMDHEKRGVSACLFVRFLPGYPKMCPTLEVAQPQGLTESNVQDLLSFLQEKLNELEGKPMIMSLHEAAEEFLSGVVSSTRDLVLVHLLRLACSLTRDLSAGFTEISKELYDNGIFTRRALELAHQESTVFYKAFDRDISEQKASSRVSSFWGHAAEHSRYSTDFEEINSLGSGAFGHVKSCRNKIDRRIYAVKRARIRSDLTVDQVLREVSTLATLQHPNIVRYYQAWFETAVSGKLDFSSDSGSGSPAEGSSSPAEGTGSPTEGSVGQAYGSNRPKDGSDSPTDGFSSPVDGSAGTKESKIYTYLYIQMEFCPEGSLRNYLDSRNEPLKEQDTWSISLQIAKGLNHIHQNNIVHRDIKPANIFFNAESNVKIGDFGLAKFLAVEQLDSDAVGTPSVGTVTYMAPEIHRTSEKNSKARYDEKADIFSFGVVFCELWSHFGSDMERAKVLSDLKKQKVPKDWAEQFPVQCEILKLLIAKAPSDRPSATRVLELIENAIAAPFDV